MIDQIDERLKAWVETVLGSVPVTFAPPRDALADPVVHLYLTQVVPALAAPDARRSPARVMLHYLVAVRAEDSLAVHRLLGDLIFSALENPDFDLNFDPIPPEMWLALGSEPQPAFILKVPMVRELPTPDTPLVRQPLVTRLTSVTTLEGVVVGGEDYPLYGALVELPGFHMYQRTDSHGRFHFANVPADPPVKLVRVTAKGQVAELELDHSPTEPVVIRLFEENP